MRTARGAVFAFAVSAALAWGCAHATKVGHEGQKEPSGEAKREEGASRRSTPSRVPPRGDRPAVASSPEELMNPGSAKRIQEALRSRGYRKEAPSGDLDAATSGAIRRFQHDQDLAETGAPDRETLRKLGIDPSSVYATARGKGKDPDAGESGQAGQGTGSGAR